MFKSILVAAILSSYSLITSAAAIVAPPNVPLNLGIASAVKPNIMFILDDTHTMRMDFMGNYVVNSTNCRTSTNPFGRICVSNASGSNITSLSDIHVELNNRTNYGLAPNRQGLAPDTLFFAYDFNRLFFNPNITYVPAVNHLGVSMGNQLINNAQIEPLNPATAMRLRNLLTELEETHFCTTSSPTAADFMNPNRCRRNGVNTPNPFRYHIEGLPNETFRFPVRGPSRPHYFDIIPNDFCDATGVNCTSNPALGIPTPVRWCATSADALSTAVPTGLHNGRPRCQSTFTENRYRFPRIGMLHRITVPEAQHQNFANWFSYYRTRMLTLRTTVGRVFSQIGDTKRVGFKTINHDLAEFLPVSDFNNTQKQLFFNRLYTVHPSGATPLREALSRTGRYFAGVRTGINSGMISPPSRPDPMQFSCQRNFAFISTDGYWNSNPGQNLTGATIGNVNNIDAGFSRRSDVVFDGNLPGASGTLSDVALFYYQTDLRLPGSLGANGVDVSENNVPLSIRNRNNQQHMVTYALAMGVSGLVPFTRDYYRGTNRYFENIRLGAIGACGWTSGVCNWPVPVGNTATAIDDTWHAAVSGRGRYFSTQNPDEVVSGLMDALNDITATTGSGAAAAASSPNITSVNNFLYATTYRSFYWDSEIVKRIIDPITGQLSNTNVWSAATLLNSRSAGSSDTRNISFLRRNGAQTELVDFRFSAMNATERGYFTNRCITNSLSQCAGLDISQRAIINGGESVVNYLRGHRVFEGTTVTTRPLFREREFVLPAIIDSSPVFVAPPDRNWDKPGYAQFRFDNRNRVPMLIAGSNGGKLHAFNATTGQELWAIVPQQIMHRLYNLADTNYHLNHEFFINGEITVIDAQINGTWRTVLIAGMGHGSRGYFALDITNPTSPTPLWEFCADGSVCSVSDSELGLTFGNPIITQRYFDSRWVAYLSSGFDNPNGRGIIYELDLATGQILRRLNANIPSSNNNQIGISKINAFFTDFNRLNRARSLYAGDLRGNVWYFDLTQNTPSVLNGSILARATDPNGNPQPITTKIELGTIQGHEVLFFGTGRYLNFGDFNTNQINTVYAIRNNRANNGILRTNTGMVEQTLQNTSDPLARNITRNPVSWTNNLGWFFDLNSQPGERITIKPKLTLGTLGIISNIPQHTACEAGGSSWFYQIDFLTGGAVRASNLAGTRLPFGFIVGQVVVQLPNTGRLVNFVTNTRGDIAGLGLVTGEQSDEINVHNWRQLLNEN